MRIRSRFKDYYDFVEHLYGGGDPKIVYNREIIEDPSPDGKSAHLDARDIPTSCGFLVPKEYDHQSIRRVPEDQGSMVGEILKEGEVRTQYRALAVAGRLFLTQQEKTGVKNPEKPHGLCIPKVTVPRHVIGDHVVNYRYGPPVTYYSGREVPALLVLHKYVKAPVFLYDWYGSDLRIEHRVPNLGELGLASFMPAEQLYQELSMFMGKLYGDNPDMMPKAPMTDIQKVESHGFDKKKSFRHRK